MTRAEIEIGLMAGERLVLRSKDDPEVPIVLQMADEGLVNAKVLRLFGQSPALEVTWK